MTFQMFEQPRNDPVIRRRARDIRERDANFRIAFDPVPQRLGADWIVQRAQVSAFLVGQPGIMRRLDDGRSFRKINREMSLPVSEIYFHCIGTMPTAPVAASY